MNNQYTLPPGRHGNFNNLQINKMICVPTEHAYNNMYQRSFTLGANYDQLDHVTQFLNEQNVHNFGTVSISAAAQKMANVVKLDTRPTSRVEVPNGWQTKRLMFLMVVDEVINEATTMSYYLQGYTEHYDPSLTGKLDPNAFYYINSITTVLRVKNLATNHIDSRVYNTYNLITDPTGRASYQEVAAPNNSLQLIRPSDVISSIHANELYSGADNVVLDNRVGVVSKDANASKRINNDPIKYLSNTINSIVIGRSNALGHADVASVLNEANSYVAEEAIIDNGFIRALIQLTGELAPNYFTLNMLTRLDPHVDSKITLISSGGIVQDKPVTMLDTEETESMLNYTAENEVAQVTINSLSSAMTENLITAISGTVTNISGTPITAITDIRSFIEGIDISPYGNKIINYINTVIMPQITVNNLRIVSLAFSCDLLGDTTVSVSIDNLPYVVYRVPSFADSLFSPVITSKENKGALVEDFRNIVDTIVAASPEYQIGAKYGY